MDLESDKYRLNVFDYLIEDEIKIIEDYLKEKHQINID